MPAHTPHRPRILVVDDDHEMRHLMISHLRQMQCDILEAPDGEKGLEMILQHRPDLVLLDVRMPALTGWEVVKYLRERSEFDRMGVIMITGIGETLNEMTADLYGADDHIDKPFKLTELDFKIRRTLSRRRQLASPSEATSAPEGKPSP